MPWSHILLNTNAGIFSVFCTAAIRCFSEWRSHHSSLCFSTQALFEGRWMYRQSSNTLRVHPELWGKVSIPFILQYPSWGRMPASWSWNAMSWIFVQKCGNQFAKVPSTYYTQKSWAMTQQAPFPLITPGLYELSFYQNNMAHSGWAGNPHDLRAQDWSSLLCLLRANKLCALGSHTCSKYLSWKFQLQRLGSAQGLHCVWVQKFAVISQFPKCQDK